MDNIIQWMKSIGFMEFPYVMQLRIKIPKLDGFVLCTINKEDIITKEDVILRINETKIKAIKKYMEGQIVNDENMNTLRTFIEALGYEKKDNGIWKLKFEYKMPSKTYEDSVMLDEEDLKNMTLNDAMLRAMDTKRSKETELEFKMKYDTESVNTFVEQFDCPTCPK